MKVLGCFKILQLYVEYSSFTEFIYKNYIYLRPSLSQMGRFKYVFGIFRHFYFMGLNHSHLLNYINRKKYDLFHYHTNPHICILSQEKISLVKVSQYDCLLSLSTYFDQWYHCMYVVLLCAIYNFSTNPTINSPHKKQKHGNLYGIKTNGISFYWYQFIEVNNLSP